MKHLIISLFTLCIISCSQGKSETKTVKVTPKETTTMTKSPDLTKFGIANYEGNVLGGLKVGDTAPDFTLDDENGNSVSLSDQLKDGPVLLVFYRADWCPYCTKHLAEFQENIIDIKAKGKASVIAISPQTPKYSKALTEEHGYTFPILYDIDHVAMKDYKVFFRVTDEYNEKIFNYKGDYIQTRNDDTNPYMPVPATYMIGQDKKIKYVHYDVNYKERGDVEEALSSVLN
jgi:peroxiredoxin